MEVAPRIFAADTLLSLLADLAQHVEGVRRGVEVEAVHQMRVASRRLRTAMELLEPWLPKAEYRRWRKRVKRVTRALGDARDVDVQVQAVEAALAPAPKGDRPGLERLGLRLAQRREALQPELIKALARMQDELLGDLRSGLVAWRASPAEPGAAAGVGELVEAARAGVLRRVDEMMAYEPFIARPQHVTELHDMRIAAKHLRYALETFAPLFKGQFGWQMKAAREVQSRLGEVHDADVWIEFLPEFQSQERERFERFFGHGRGFTKIERGVRAFLEAQRARRSVCYEEFLAWWREESRCGQWVELRRSVSEAAVRAKVLGGRATGSASGAVAGTALGSGSVGEAGMEPGMDLASEAQAEPRVIVPASLPLAERRLG